MLCNLPMYLTQHEYYVVHPAYIHFIQGIQLISLSKIILDSRISELLPVLKGARSVTDFNVHLFAHIYT